MIPSASSTTRIPHAVRLRTNGRGAPLGIDDPMPSFSWQLAAPASPAEQGGYTIQVAEDGDFDSALVWDSGRIVGDEQTGVRYAGPPLASCTRYVWRARLHDTGGAASDWSEPAVFETGVLDGGRWRASWISGPPVTADDVAALYLRGRLQLPAAVVRGRAYASALGWYRLFVNGTDLTGPALVPRFTPLDKVVEYQAYDVTEHFREGANIVGIAVGDGRYRGRLGVLSRRSVYGTRLAGFVQFELDLADGTSVCFTTDEGWSAGTGRITRCDPKHGEHADLSVPDGDWLTAPQPPDRFSPAHTLPSHPRRLIAEETARVGEIDRLPAARIWRSPSGRQLADFGQNMAGVVHLRLSGPAGTRVRLTHSELLTPAGELDTDYMIADKSKPWYQRDEITLDGTNTSYQPWFTIHGFRYVEIQGLAQDLTPDDIEAVVLSSQLEQAGTFACSDERLTRLWHNVLWSTRSNFTDTPTDCPTRERSGWTGDIQAFTPTATGMVDAHTFLTRYLRNLALEQFPDGRVPPFVPAEASTTSTGRATWMLARTLANSTGWGDAAVLIPWNLYHYYGDHAVLERQYPSMRAWVEYMARIARTRRGLPRRVSRRRAGTLERYVLDSGFHWGEWLRPGEHFPANALEGTLRGAVVATAYLAHSSRVLARTATVLGRDRDAHHYDALSENVREAWRAAFLHPDGTIGTDRQDDYVRALAFDLLRPAQRPRAAARLVNLIEEAGYHLATGFLSTPMLLQVLTDTGHADTAFKLLLQSSPPSWLHQVELGATTIWETWEGYTETGEATASHNHYAYGSIACWLRETLLGITPAEPGYRHIRIAPITGGGIHTAQGTLQTPYGTVGSAWRANGDDGELNVTVPPGTRATVHLPDRTVHPCGPGQHTYTWKLPDREIGSTSALAE